MKFSISKSSYDSYCAANRMPYIHIVSTTSNDNRLLVRLSICVYIVLWIARVCDDDCNNTNNTTTTIHRPSHDSRSGKKRAISFGRLSVHNWISPASHSELPRSESCIIFSCLYPREAKKKNNFIHKPLLCQCVSIKTQYLVLIRIIRYILSFAFSAKVFKFLWETRTLGVSIIPIKFPFY